MAEEVLEHLVLGEEVLLEFDDLVEHRVGVGAHRSRILDAVFDADGRRRLPCDATSSESTVKAPRHRGA